MKGDIVNTLRHMQLKRAAEAFIAREMKVQGLLQDDYIIVVTSASLDTDKKQLEVYYDIHEAPLPPDDDNCTGSYS